MCAIAAHIFHLFVSGKAKEKCHKYWPDLTESASEFSCGLRVRTVAEDTSWGSSPHFCTHRTFSVTSTNIRSPLKAVLQQYQLTGWSEKRVPDSPKLLREFIGKLLLVGITRSPMLVHCSDGSGRTGSFIAALKAITERRPELGLREIVLKLRQDRAQMVSKSRHVTPFRLMWLKRSCAVSRLYLPLPISF